MEALHCMQWINRLLPRKVPHIGFEQRGPASQLALQLIHGASEVVFGCLNYWPFAIGKFPCSGHHPVCKWHCADFVECIWASDAV